jgi:hypothetical protein
LDPNASGIQTSNGKMRYPDHVEVYLSSGIVFDVLFFDEEDQVRVFAADIGAYKFEGKNDGF